MASIITRCPATLRLISTGLRTEMVNFDSLPDVAVPVCCPECGEKHRWRPADAWVEDVNADETKRLCESSRQNVGFGSERLR